MHEGNGLSCKEQVRQKKREGEEKKMQGWGDEAVCTEKRDKSRKDTGKKEEDKGRCGSRGHLVTTQSGTTIAHVETTKAAHKKQTWDRETGGERRREKGREKRKLNSPTRRTIRAWVSLSCNLDQTPKSNE